MSIRIDNASDYAGLLSGIPNPGTITITFWFYIVQDRNNYSILFIFLDGSNNYQEVLLDSNGTTLRIATQDLGTNGTDLSVGTWYHVAYVFDGTTRRVYLNGNLDITQVDSALLTPIYFIFGSDTVYWANGRFADMRVWSATLTQAEIQTEMRSPIAVRTANLFADYRTPSGSTRVNDFSGNGHNLTPGGTLTDEADPPYTFTASSTDSGALSDNAASSVSTASTDSATLSESVTINQGGAKAASDSASVNESTTLFAALSSSDSGTLHEETTVAGSLGVDDGALSESASIANLISATDSAALSESSSITRVIIGGSVLQGIGEVRQADGHRVVVAGASLSAYSDLVGSGKKISVSSGSLPVYGETEPSGKKISVSSGSLPVYGQTEPSGNKLTPAGAAPQAEGSILSNGLKIAENSGAELISRGEMTAGYGEIHILTAGAEFSGVGTMEGAGGRLAVSQGASISHGMIEPEGISIKKSAGGIAGYGNQIPNGSRIGISGAQIAGGSLITAGYGNAQVITASAEIQGRAALNAAGTREASGQAVISESSALQATGVCFANAQASLSMVGVITAALIIVAVGGGSFNVLSVSSAGGKRIVTQGALVIGSASMSGGYAPYAGPKATVKVPPTNRLSKALSINRVIKVPGRR